MKITFLSASLDLSGGSRVIAKYADELSLRGHDVTVVEFKRLPRLKDELVKRIRGILKGSPSKSNEQSNHFEDAHFKVLRLRGKDRIPADKVPDADVVVASWWETVEWVNSLPPSKGKGVHFIQGHEVFPYVPIERAEAVYRSKLKKIVISEWLAQLLTHRYHQSDLTLIHNAIDHNVFKGRPRDKNERPTIGFVYTPTPVKGTPHIMEALKRLKTKYPELRVVTFGASHPKDDGIEMPAYFEFTHQPSQDKIPGLYAQTDVWLIGSKEEGFSLPALEAMATATPVISTNMGWPMEAIREGVNGYFYEYGNVDNLYEQLERLVLMPAANWKDMSAAALTCAKKLSWEASTSKFEGALLELHHRDTQTGQQR